MRPKRRSISPSDSRSRTGRPCGQCERRSTPSSWREQAHGLVAPEHVARAHDAVARHRREHVVDAVERLGRGRALGQLAEHVAQERLRIGVLEHLGHGAHAHDARAGALDLEAERVERGLPRALDDGRRRLVDLDGQREEQALAPHLAPAVRRARRA